MVAAAFSDFILSWKSGSASLFPFFDFLSVEAAAV